METYKFYMQTINKDGSVPENSVTKNLEQDFRLENDGLVVGQLRYKQCKGLNTIGKPRVYTEVYANSDTLRSYVPPTPFFEASDVELSLYFMGEERQSVFDLFNEFILGGYRKYWDTARNKTFDFFVKDKVEVSKEMWYGGMPYFEVTYKLQNLNGKTSDVQ